MKRFTETLKWSKEWFQELSPVQKCLWMYLCDNCDHAGVWDPNWKLATFQIGAKVSADMLKAFGSRVSELKTGKIIILTFVDFQYGKLSEACPAHKTVFRAIESHGIKYPIESLTCYPSVRVQEQEKEKEKEKEGECKGETKEVDISHLTQAAVEAWNDWHAFRKEIKKPVGPTADKILLQRLKELGETEWIGRIKQSIQNGWQGVFENKEAKNGHQNNRPTHGNRNAGTLNEGRAAMYDYSAIQKARALRDAGRVKESDEAGDNPIPG